MTVLGNAPADLRRKIEHLAKAISDLEAARSDRTETKNELRAQGRRIFAVFLPGRRRRIRKLDRDLQRQWEKEEALRSVEEDVRAGAHDATDRHLRENDRGYGKQTEHKVSVETAADHWESVRKRMAEALSAIGQAKNQMTAAYAENKSYRPASLRSFQNLENALSVLHRTLAEFETRVSRLDLPGGLIGETEFLKSDSVKAMRMVCGKFGTANYSETYRTLESWADRFSKQTEKATSPVFIQKADRHLEKHLFEKRERWISECLSKGFATEPADRPVKSSAAAAHPFS